MRLPSRLVTENLDFLRLFGRYVLPGARVLEIGCAPGKNLAAVAGRLGARVAGLDYSRAGIDTTRRLFDSLGLEADLRCEDLFGNSFQDASFDLVYSMGVIEHFDDPRPAVMQHLRLLRPSGTAVLTIPNYGGVYGRLQGRFDPDNLRIHNLEIMSPERLRALAPAEFPGNVRAFPFGRVSASLVSWERRLPRAFSVTLRLALNALGLVQPLDVPRLAPWLVLEARRSPA